MSAQRDRDGAVLKELPPVWGGLTAKGVTPPVTEAPAVLLASSTLRELRNATTACTSSFVRRVA